MPPASETSHIRYDTCNIMFEELSELLLKKNAQIAELQISLHNCTYEVKKAFMAGFEYGIATDIDCESAWDEYQKGAA
jgi:hypothetical protein